MGDLVWRKVGSSVECYPRLPAAVRARDGDVDGSGSGWVREESVEKGCAVVAQDREFADGEDRGHLRLPMLRDWAEPVNAAADPDQAAGPDPTVDGVPVHAPAKQLPAGDKPVLTTDQPLDLADRWRKNTARVPELPMLAVFSPHIEENPALIGAAPAEAVFSARGPTTRRCGVVATARASPTQPDPAGWPQLRPGGPGTGRYSSFDSN
jgi:hypothetical protein